MHYILSIKYTDKIIINLANKPEIKIPKFCTLVNFSEI